jgi:two-component system sensor histidine kinase RpfC
LLEENEYAVAIVDMHMPEMGGIEAAKLFRFARADRASMPFIVLTANATVDALKECEEARMDAYLTKPIEAAQLVRTVSAVLARSEHTARQQTHNDAAGKPKLSLPSPALPPNGPALDRQKIAALEGLGGGRPFVRELTNNFLTEAQKVVDRMSQAWQNDDRGALQNQATVLMDGAGTIGANLLRDLASDLAATANNDASQRTGDVARIRSELARVKNELDSYLRRRDVTQTGR